MGIFTVNGDDRKNSNPKEAMKSNLPSFILENAIKEYCCESSKITLVSIIYYYILKNKLC